MERHALHVNRKDAREPSVRWSIDGTEDDWKLSRYGDENIGNYRLELNHDKNLNKRSEILVDIESGPSGVSNANTPAPSVSSTLETETQCSRAPSGFFSNIQNSRGCFDFSNSACSCGWCAKKPEEFNSTRRFNEAINPEVQSNPNAERSCWIANLSSIQRRNFMAYAILFLIAVIAITIVLIHFTVHPPLNQETQNQSVTTVATVTNYCTGATAENLDWYVSRESWEASDPKYNLETSSHERAYVMVGHTVTSYCTELARCSQLMRSLQTSAINAGNGDISYHFVIGGDGRAYEGRNWQAAPANPYDCDNDCLFVSFTGDYRNCCSAPNHIPSEEQMQAFDYILDTSRRLNRLKEDFTILPQCKVASSQSPGSNLYNVIKNCNQFDSIAATFTGLCNFNCAGEC